MHPNMAAHLLAAKRQAKLGLSMYFDITKDQLQKQPSLNFARQR